MAWIEMLTEDEAASRGGRLARLFQAAKDPDRGAVDNVLRIHSLRPETMDAHLRLYRSAMHDRGATTMREREAIAIVVSAYNACHY